MTRIRAHVAHASAAWGPRATNPAATSRPARTPQDQGRATANPLRDPGQAAALNAAYRGRSPAAAPGAPRTARAWRPLGHRRPLAHKTQALNYRRTQLRGDTHGYGPPRGLARRRFSGA
jgi:hypothetical protein